MDTSNLAYGGQVENRNLYGLIDFIREALLASQWPPEKQWHQIQPFDPNEGQSPLAQQLGYGDITMPQRNQIDRYRPGKGDLGAEPVVEKPPGPMPRRQGLPLGRQGPFVLPPGLYPQWMQ